MPADTRQALHDRAVDAPMDDPPRLLHLVGDLQAGAPAVRCHLQVLQSQFAVEAGAEAGRQRCGHEISVYTFWSENAEGPHA